jgi:hypothetical protein
VTEYNDFETDLHRRVAGNLTIPRPAEGIVLAMERHDPTAINFESGVYDRGQTTEQIGEVLSDLEADGVVSNIGEVDGPEEAIDAVNADDNVVNVDNEEQQERFIALVNSDLPKRRHLNVDGELWILTNKGLEKLLGPVPGEE